VSKFILLACCVAFDLVSGTASVWSSLPLYLGAGWIGSALDRMERKINRRPEHSVVTDLLVQMQNLRNEVLKLELEGKSLKQELRIINPLS
jgi:hypothetical protein